MPEKQKKRISITLSPEIQGFIDEMIGEKRFSSYQHAIEFCLHCLATKKMLLMDDQVLSKLDKIIELMETHL